MVAALRARGWEVFAGSRGGVGGFAFDLEDEASIAAAAGGIGGELDLVVVASGVLRDEGRGIAPEKTWRAIDGAAMARVFAVNAIGPALVAKHFLPMLPRGRRGVFAVLSAPFRPAAAEGVLAPELSAAALLGVIDGLAPGDSGGFFAWDGSMIDW